MKHIWLVLEDDENDSNPLFAVESEQEVIRALSSLGKGHYAKFVSIRDEWAKTSSNA